MSKPDVIRLLIVDDHPMVRDGLRRIQEIDPRLEVIGEAATARAAVEMAQQLSPNVLLMDVRLPDGTGIEACRRVKHLLPEARVLFLTSYADNQFVLAAMEAGADGYLLKESDAARIVEAIHFIMRGGTVFDPIVAREMASHQKKGAGTNPLEALTVRELRVLGEVARGRTDKEVAAALGLSSKTARNYLDRIFAKLNVHTRTEAAMLYARRSGETRSF